jgi:hypothetical protein
VRAAGGKIPLSFDYVISAVHSEHAAAASAIAVSPTSSHGGTAEGSGAAEQTVFMAVNNGN